MITVYIEFYERPWILKNENVKNGGRLTYVQKYQI